MFVVSTPFPTLSATPFQGAFEALIHLIASALAAGHALITRAGLPANSSLGWILAIVAVVAAVRVALLPVAVHGVRLAHAGARARPHLRELQQRYAGRTDPDGVRELLAARRALNAEHGVSRLGCLPLLLQLPILFALYAVLVAVANRQPVGAMDAALVASAGSASILGVSLADRWGDALGHSAGHALVVILLAVAAASLSYLTQRYAVLPNQVLDGLPEAFAQAQRVMPAVSAIGILVGAVAVPLGLLVYWVANTAFTLIQQGVITRYAPTPGSPAYAARAARRAGPS